MNRSKSLRRIVWEDRLRALLRIGVAVLIVGGILAGVSLYSLGSVTDRTGVVTAVMRESSEQGQIRTEILLRLDDGQTVKARVAYGPPPFEGQNITVQEQQTALFGIRRYHYKP